MTTLLDDIWIEILEERKRQISKGYTSEHDDGHGGYDWFKMVATENMKGGGLGWTRKGFRKSMIRVAAVCVAALEWIAR